MQINTKTHKMDYQVFLNDLWIKYCFMNPSVKEVNELMAQRGESMNHDYLVFNTFNIPEINTRVMSIPLIQMGYTEVGLYEFNRSNIVSKHFKHKFDTNAPQIIIHELLLNRHSSYMQSTFKRLVREIPINVIASDVLIISENNWGKPSYEVYEQLKSESEYASWIYVHGFTVNHFVLNVICLNKIQSIVEVNNLLKANGYTVKKFGNHEEILGSPERLFEFSCLQPDLINVEFQEGVFEVNSSSYSFIKRYSMDEGRVFQELFELIV